MTGAFSLWRYYDPATGQFLTVDSVVDKTSQAYAYAQDDPVAEADPLGLCPSRGASRSLTSASSPIAPCGAFQSVSYGLTTIIIKRIADQTTPSSYAYYVEFQVQLKYREFVADPGSLARIDVYGTAAGSLKSGGRIQSAQKIYPRGWAAHTRIVVAPRSMIEIKGKAVFSPEPATNLVVTQFGSSYTTISSATQVFSCIAGS